MADEPLAPVPGAPTFPPPAAPWEPGVDFAAGPWDGGGPEPRLAFELGERVHWRAWFGRPAGAARIDVVTVARDAAGWERVVSGHDLWLAHPAVPGYAGWLDPPAYRTPGRFVLRFVRGDQVLAEGEFEVLEPPRDRPASGGRLH